MIGRILIVAAILNLMSEPASAQDAGASPTHGSLALAAGFSPDPKTISFDADGESVNAGALSAACAGLIGEAADVHLDYTEGDDIPLFISVASASATALLLRGPDGAWYCDAGGEGAPGLHFTRPQSGRYAIWVASPAGAQAVELRFSANLVQYAAAQGASLFGTSLATGSLCAADAPAVTTRSCAAPVPPSRPSAP